MHPHLVGLLVGEILSVLLGFTEIILGIVDITNDSYGLVLGFVGIFNGLALIACFLLYVVMLRKKMVFPKILIGFSIGLSVICLQSLFVWAGFQTKLFENYTQKVFELDASMAGQLSQCQGYCVDYKTGSVDLMDYLLTSTTQDYGLERAGAAISVVALIVQILIIACSFLLWQAQQMGVGGPGAPTAKAATDGFDESEGLDTYAPAPENSSNDRSLLANF